jgi:hypothetical protein
MSSALEDRVARLEDLVAKISELVLNEGKKDWRRTLGMFGEDEVMKDINREALRYRQADRKKSRKRQRSTRSSKR